MKKLRAFFYYYGAKNKLALRYPAPKHDTVVEPFAGSAAYSLAYPHLKICLVDKDPQICGIWDYLIKATEADVLALPDLPQDGRVEDLHVCQEAKWLIGMNLAAANQNPRNKWTSWAWAKLNETSTMRSQVWSQECRQKIADQQRYIRHWKIVCCGYDNIPPINATWFVDPPYQVAGKHYKHGAKTVDFSALGNWCRSLPGQVIVCEAAGADWLPFEPFAEIASQGRLGEKKGSGRAKEVIWYRET